MKIKNVLLLTLLLIIATIFIPNYVNAGYGDRFTVNDIEYIIVQENGSNNLADVYAYRGNGKELIIPETVEYDGKEFNVISIGYSSYMSIAYNQSVTSITIPKSISYIFNEAFNGFDNLKGLKVSEENIKYSSIEGVLFSKDKTELMCYPKGKEETTYVIPNTTEKISGKAFKGSVLTNIIIPNSMTEIGNDAFNGATKLINITIPNTVTSIGDYAFFGCTSLTSITIPVSVTTIKDNVFYDCISLTNITIPKSVTSIGNDAFLNCTKLKAFKVDEENQNYSSLDDVLFNKDKTEIVCYPDGKDGSTYCIPNSVVTIGAGAFGESKLKRVTIPNSVKTIKTGAFGSCELLTEIAIPNSVTTIEDYVFAWCNNLKSVIIPNSVISMGDRTFFFGAYNVPTTIYCNKDSYAENYAKQYNINYKIASIYSVTNKLTNILSNGELYTSPEIGDYIITLTPNKGYKLSEYISVRIDGYDLSSDDYEYNSETGNLKISADTIIGNIEIEAVAEKIYKISFDANGGDFSNGKDVLIFEDVDEFDYDNLEEPTRKGYEFIGYYNEDEKSLENIMNSEVGIEEDMVFYAKWEEKVLKQIKVFEHSENQEFVIGTDKELVFELNNDGGEGKVFVDGKELNEKDGYYTWNFVEGIYPSIALSEEYIKTLKIGKYTIKFIIDDELYAETTFTIVENKSVEDEEQENIENNVEDSNSSIDKEENNSEKDKTDNNSEKEENKLDNPKTGDSILVFVGLFMISIIGILATTKFRKNYKNK